MLCDDAKRFEFNHICQSLTLRAEFTDIMSTTKKLSQDYFFISLWDLNITLFDILRRLLQKKKNWTFSEVPLYDRIFPYIGYVRKSMRNNIIKKRYLKASYFKLKH